jgi:hypothetical protein
MHVVYTLVVEPLLYIVENYTPKKIRGNAHHWPVYLNFPLYFGKFSFKGYNFSKTYLSSKIRKF